MATNHMETRALDLVEFEREFLNWKLYVEFSSKIDFSQRKNVETLKNINIRKKLACFKK
jgi:hypothetical protein